MVVFSGRSGMFIPLFQYSLCRVVLMVSEQINFETKSTKLSVLALSSRFDGRSVALTATWWFMLFQYSLCRVVLMVTNGCGTCVWWISLSVLALSSRFDGRMMRCGQLTRRMTFSTRSVESF